MPRFSRASELQLATLHPDLQKVLREAIQYIDFTVVEGHRGKRAQDEAYAKGLSKVRWPNGHHNSMPSRAVDLAPYPIDWSESPKALERFVYLAGFIMCTARRMGIPLRWGGNWMGRDDMRLEGSFRDRPHFELMNPADTAKSDPAPPPRRLDY